MKLQKTSKTLLFTALILVLSFSVAANPDVSINDLPSEVEVGESFDVDVSATGDDLEDVQVNYREEDSFWRIDRKECDGSFACSIQESYSFDEEKTMEFQGVATDSYDNHDETDIQTVEIVSESEEDEPEVKDVSMNNLPNSVTKGDSINIKGSATGNKLDEVRIEKWYNNEWRTKDCNQESACSIDKDYQTSETGTLRFRIVAEAGTEEKSTSYQSVEVEKDEKDGQIDSISMNNLPSKVKVSEDVNVKGSVTGNKLDKIEIRTRSEYGSWNTWRTKDCNQESACSIDKDYSQSSEGNKYFKVKAYAGDKSDKTSSQKVGFYKEEEEDPKVETVSMNNLPSSVEKGSSINVKGSATGVKLDEIRIEKWYNNEWRSKNCDQKSACSIDRDYQTSETGTLRFRIVAEAGTDKKSTSYQSVEVEKEEEEDPRIDSISMNDLPSKVKVGKDVNVKGSVTGNKLDKIEIRTRSEYGSWNTWRTKDCEQSWACSIDRDYTQYSEGTKYFKVKAYAGSNTDKTGSEKVEFYKEDDKKCSVSVGELNLDPSTIYEGESSEASVKVDNKGDRQKFNVEFRVDGDTVSTRSRTIDSESSYNFETSLSPSDTSTVRAVVRTEGEPCKDKRFDRVNELYVTDKPEEREPKADFTFTPKEPEVSENIAFDGSDSRAFDGANIVNYRWDMGDGNIRYGKTIDHSYSSEGTYSVELEVEDSRGDTDTKTRFVTVGKDEKPGKCKVEVEELKLNPSTIYEGESSEASVRINNKGDTQKFNIEFRKDGERFDRQTVTIGSSESRNVETEVSPGERSTIRAVIKTEGEPCKDKRFDRVNELFVIDPGTGDAKLDVSVKDNKGNTLQGAKVTAENSDYQTKTTNSQGKAFFDLTAGDYTVTAEKESYYSSSKSITLEEDDHKETSLTLNKKDDGKESGIDVSKISHKSSVCKGYGLNVDYQIENTGEKDEVIDVTASAFNEEIKRSFVLDAGEKQNREVKFTNARPLGTQEIEIKASNGDSDVETSYVEVKDCSDDKDRDDEKEDDKMEVQPTRLTANVNPSRVIRGETVTVRGYVEGVQGSSEVEVKVDGRTATRTSTRRDGYYQAYIRPDRVGTRNIEVISGDKSRHRTVEVLDSANVDYLDAPSRTFQGESFEVCGNVESQQNSRVLLLQDGEVINSADTRGETCFDVVGETVGEKEFKMRALSSGRDSSATTRVEVLEQGAEVKKFPDQVASVRSGDSVVKVELYNTEDSVKEYNLELSDLPSTWVSQSEKTVKIPKGERKEVYFYLTPRDEGEFRPTVDIESDGETIYSEEVVVEVGGSDQVSRKSIWTRFWERVSFL